MGPIWRYWPLQRSISSNFERCPAVAMFARNRGASGGHRRAARRPTRGRGPRRGRGTFRRRRRRRRRRPHGGGAPNPVVYFVGITHVSLGMNFSTTSFSTIAIAGRSRPLCPFVFFLQDRQQAGRAPRDDAARGRVPQDVRELPLPLHRREGPQETTACPPIVITTDADASRLSLSCSHRA